MKKVYSFKTSVGVFYIEEKENRYHPTFQNLSLGSYFSPEQAAEDLAGGHTFTPPTGVDTSSLGIPYSLNEWVKLF